MSAKYRIHAHYPAWFTREVEADSAAEACKVFERDHSLKDTLISGVEDAEGAALGFIVDVVGDENYEQTTYVQGDGVTIYLSEQQRELLKAAPALLEALTNCCVEMEELLRTVADNQTADNIGVRLGEARAAIKQATQS